MKISEAISKINDLKPNSYTEEEKVYWLSQLDGVIFREIIKTHEDRRRRHRHRRNDFPGYPYDSTATPPYTDKEMLVPFPYDDIYLKWLESQIDYCNGELIRYNNSIVTFNNAYSSYERLYNREHMPKGTQFRYF